MHETNVRRRIVGYILLGVLAIGVAILVGGWAAAPTTEGLILHAVGQEGLAGVGNNEEAYVVISVYNAAGPVGGLAGGSFSVEAVVVAPLGTSVTKSRVAEAPRGVYLIGVVPTKASTGWQKGHYIVAVTLTSPNGSGVTVADLSVDL
ncbi:MAG: hypothetical protein NTY63_08095 [Candidatus Bipolaricaulota bacterium]|nr:hypothetical protein [Candidatus Bipolaricaulota bacterium]